MSPLTKTHHFIYSKIGWAFIVKCLLRLFTHKFSFCLNSLTWAFNNIGLPIFILFLHWRWSRRKTISSSGFLDFIVLFRSLTTEFQDGVWVESNRYEESMVEFHWDRFIVVSSRRIRGRDSLVSFRIKFLCSETLRDPLKSELTTISEGGEWLHIKMSVFFR